MGIWKTTSVAIVCLMVLGGCRKQKPAAPEEEPAAEAAECVEEAEAAPETEAEAAAEPEPQPEAEQAPAPEPAPEPAAEPAPEPALEQPPEPEAPAQPEPKAETQTQAEPEDEPEARTADEPEQQADLEDEDEPEADTEDDDDEDEDESPATAPAEPASQAVSPDAIIVEIESFELHNCTVEDLAAASGAKVVLLDKDNSWATKQVTLAKGRYAITAYALASDGSHDAFLLTAGESAEMRLFPDGWGSLRPTKEKLVIRRAADGPCELSIQVAETGVKLDRLVIEPVE